MKKALFLLAFAAILFAGCSQIDDLDNRLKKVEGDVSSLSSQISSLNSDFSSLKQIVDALNGKITITAVTDNKDGSYTIYFSNNTSATIKNGQNGQNGQNGADGVTPKFKIEGGFWFVSFDKGDTWAQLGQATGNNGSNGADGITPKFKIENGKWYVSYDEGKSWTEMGQATGSDGENGINGVTPEFKIEDGKWFVTYDKGATWKELGQATGAGGSGVDGVTPEFKIEDGKWFVSYDKGETWTEIGKATGDAGTSIYDKIEVFEDYVVITLVDETVIKLPLYKEPVQSFVSQIKSVKFIPKYVNNGVAFAFMDIVGMKETDYYDVAQLYIEENFLVQPASLAGELATHPEYFKAALTGVQTKSGDMYTGGFPTAIRVLDGGYVTVRMNISEIFRPIFFNDPNWFDKHPDVWYYNTAVINLVIDDGVSAISSDYFIIGDWKEYDYIKVGDDFYRIAKMDDDRWWMIDNLAYLPEGMEVSSQDFKTNTGIWNPVITVYDPATGTAKGVPTDNPGLIKGMGYYYTEAVALDDPELSMSKDVDVSYNQGICPAGWHIPTAWEWIDLVGKCNDKAYTDDSAPYYDSTLEGGNLSFLNHGGYLDESSYNSYDYNTGFNMYPYGFVNGGTKYNVSVLNKASGNPYQGMNSMDYFASSTGRSATQSYALMISNVAAKTTVAVGYNTLTNGVHVRCIKD